MNQHHETEHHTVRGIIWSVLTVLGFGLIMIYAARPSLMSYGSQCPSQTGVKNTLFCTYVRTGTGQLELLQNLPNPWLLLGLVVFVVIAGLCARFSYGGRTRG